MTTTTRRIRHMAALGAAAAGLVLYPLSGLVMAPAVHADPYTDIVNNLDVVYAAGNELFTLGGQYLALGEPTYALDAYLAGVDNTLIAPLENLYIDGLDVLRNTPVANPFDIEAVPVPADFAGGLAEAQGYYDIAQTDFTQAANLLTIGDFPLAEQWEVLGNNALWVEAPNALLLSIFGA